MNGPIDSDLLGRLLDEYGPALALYAAQWTDAADDCVQDALVELARQPAVPEHVVAWLYRVVKHRALNAARSARRRRERETRAASLRLRATGFASADSERTLAEPVAPVESDRLDALIVAEALERLEADLREIIVMRVWGGLSFEEIAAALGVSISTAHRRYQAALGQLRQILELPCPTNTNPTSGDCRPN
jgi:RNA polymerase sigma factor (sigma-70 family)